LGWVVVTIVNSKNSIECLIDLNKRGIRSNTHLRNLDRPSRYPDDRSLPAFANCLTPDAAVNKVQRMEQSDRSIHGIGITTDLDLDVFSIRHYVSHPCFLGLFLTPKN
jgi:hypothetical protein